MENDRDPRSVPGDFYVGADECITCGAPEHEAPDLMRMDEDGCFFAKQPDTPQEVERAVMAVWVSCCDAVRYRGNDPVILERLKQLEGVASDVRRPWWKFW